MMSCSGKALLFNMSCRGAFVRMLWLPNSIASWVSKQALVIDSSAVPFLCHIVKATNPAVAPFMPRRGGVSRTFLTVLARVSPAETRLYNLFIASVKFYMLWKAKAPSTLHQIVFLPAEEWNHCNCQGFSSASDKTEVLRTVPHIGCI